MQKIQAALRLGASTGEDEVDRSEGASAFSSLVGQTCETLERLCALAREVFSVETALIALNGPDRQIVLARADVRPGRHAELDSCAFRTAAALTEADGGEIGALWLADANPRVLTGMARQRLREFAALASQEMRTQREVQALRRGAFVMSQGMRVAQIGMFEIDVGTGVRTWSDELHHLLGNDAVELDPAEFARRLLSEQDRKWIASLKGEGGACDYQSRVVQYASPNGALRWLRVHMMWEKCLGRGCYYGAVQDITELHESRLEVERLAFRDALTDLPNRAFFNKRFEECFAHAKATEAKLGLILVDLDHFKDINDSLGHDSGDALLRAVSERMSRVFRHSDIVARLGGDEFAVILPDIKDEGDLKRPVDALMDLLRQPVDHGGNTFAASASVGGAIYEYSDEESDQLLKNADIALYEAKLNGRNRLVTFAPTMRTAVENRAAMIREVRQGLHRKEFVLYYQPVVNVAPEAVTGFEALMRWNHPSRGVLAPAAFMAAFDEHDLAPIFCDLTLDTAMAQMRAWIEDGVPFGRVAVNISSAQFRAPNLADRIEAKLRHWGVPPDRLTIEVTENVYMGWGSDVVGDTVRQLHAAGVMIALDDFGTGYASLANLRQFPIDRLKIDKSFVQSGEDDAIVRAVITLGASLGMKVVAEGVEEREQLNFLAANGCDQVQGYHYAAPMPGAQVPDFLRNFTAAPAEPPKR